MPSIQSDKDEILGACRNNLLVVMAKLDPIEDMIDSAYSAPGNEALYALYKKINALDSLLEAEVSKLNK